MDRSVFFRSLELDDVNSIYKWMNDCELMKDAVGMKRPWSLLECREWVEKRMKQGPYNFWFAICLNDESKKMIGYTGVNDIHYVNSSATCNAVVIGDSDSHDGFTWLDTYILVREFVFETLHLNRFYGCYSETQKLTALANKLFFSTVEGIERQAIWQNGEYHDIHRVSILREEYLFHKNNGDFEKSNLLKRLRKLLKE